MVKLVTLLVLAILIFIASGELARLTDFDIRLNLKCYDPRRKHFSALVTLWEYVMEGHRNATVRMRGYGEGDFGFYYEPYIRIVHNCQAPYKQFVTIYHYIVDCEVNAQVCKYNETVVLGV